MLGGYKELTLDNYQACSKGSLPPIPLNLFLKNWLLIFLKHNSQKIEKIK
jgi:hypothetical protein